ncbi:MAG: AAA family ATPase [Candidatus Nanopelagicales bacterium]
MQPHPDLALEQEHLELAYSRLDALRALARARLATAMRQGNEGTHQNRSERDSFTSLYTDRLAALDAVENRLVFGRTDTDEGSTWIGRIGLTDETQRVLQIDWRAPAAAPFYQATAANPLGVRRRRHISTEGRSVTSISDEVLDPELAGTEGSDSSDSALLAALGAARTGRMGDIVATIQAEQDRIIRSGSKGALVVQGGPGTGKTAVALHRAAYLLYTHRDRLERSGVLVLGPTSVFLRYVEAVLPSLGETGVVLSSIAELVPGVVATTRDRDEVAAVKGDVVMADVLAAAVRARQRVPADGVRFSMNGNDIRLSSQTVARAGREARREHDTHNGARVPFLNHMLNQAATRLARVRRIDSGDAYVREELLDELRHVKEVRRELNLLWMPLTATRVLDELLSRPAELAAAAEGRLSAEQQSLLLREPGSAFTVDDVPLLDELAELIGDSTVASDVDAARKAAEARRAEAFAARVLESSQSYDDSEGLESMAGMVSGEELASRFVETGPVLTLAERAAGDRDWAYGHVVVDEAQELSPMAWRAVGRRCPSRSMTVVGDLAQTSNGAGARSWAQALDVVTRGEWRVEELTINYRTPARIARLADRVLAAMDREVSAPRAVREGDHDPVDHRVDDLAAGVLDVVRPLVELPGRTVVVAPADRVAPLHAALRDAGIDAASGAAGLDAAVGVMTATQVKGLEFDNVVLAEPAVVGAGPSGLADLYVALTRATSRLDLVRTADLPPSLAAAF